MVRSASGAETTVTGSAVDVFLYSPFLSVAMTPLSATFTPAVSFARTEALPVSVATAPRGTEYVHVALAPSHLADTTDDEVQAWPKSA